MFNKLYTDIEYMQDVQRKELYKKNIVATVSQGKIPFYKRRRVLKLVNELCELNFLLKEDEQIDLVNNVEVWSCDCLEYNIDKIYDHILEVSLQMHSFRTENLYKLTDVGFENDLTYLMNEQLRKSKERNPIIILTSNMFTKPFVVNGNHRIRNAYNKGIETVDVYLINADDVIECLISEDYKKAYTIYVKLNKLVGIMLNC